MDSTAASIFSLEISAGPESSCCYVVIGRRDWSWALLTVLRDCYSLLETKSPTGRSAKERIKMYRKKNVPIVTTHIISFSIKIGTGNN